MDIILDLFYCFMASYFFALIMNAPKITLIRTSIFASIGYVVYEYFTLIGGQVLGFFMGTSLIAAFGEFFARKFKMPATIFIFPAVIPIVPGVGLYNTILVLVNKDITLALETGVNTILNIGCMAIAMAFISLIALKLKFKK